MSVILCIKCNRLLVLNLVQDYCSGCGKPPQDCTACTWKPGP